MPNAGYIYVLINPSMEGLVKVGKTTREPTGRAKELSGATGVPTPFVLAYEVFFDDCSAAEEFVHALLEQKGYRVSSNREFFNAPLSDAIKAVIEAERVLGSSHFTDLETASEEDHLPSSRVPWKEVLELADASYDGSGSLTIQDYAEASRLYNHAAKLGSSFACLMLGIMSKKGEACKKDSATALEFFKEGTRRGDDRCWAEMAILFLEDGNAENARKCWYRYFGSKGFREDTPSTSYTYDRWHYVLEYLEKVRSGTYSMLFNKELSWIKEELLARSGEMLNFWRYNPAGAARYKDYKKILEEVTDEPLPDNLEVLNRGTEEHEKKTAEMLREFMNLKMPL